MKLYNVKGTEICHYSGGWKSQINDQQIKLWGFFFLFYFWYGAIGIIPFSLQTVKRPRRVRSQFFIVSWIPQNHKTGNWMKTSSLVIKHQHKTIRGWKHNLILNMLEFGRNWHPFVSHSCQWFLSFISHFQRKASRASK